MSDTSVVGLGFRLIGSLALVVDLLFLLARFANKRFKSPSGATVQVVARQSLTRSSGVAVLAIGSRVLLVGTTDQQVSLLAELDPEELLADEPIDVPLPARAPSSSPLAGSLLSPATWKQTMAVFTGTPPPPEEREAS
ncbi:MAG TPA: flagellar biosynthetic protein FliO [Nocardioides sp.]|nr:flagellar biosynthetic protein FliO [Nocardioides sp.]